MAGGIAPAIGDSQLLSTYRLETICKRTFGRSWRWSSSSRPSDTTDKQQHRHTAWRIRPLRVAVALDQRQSSATTAGSVGAPKLRRDKPRGAASSDPASALFAEASRQLVNGSISSALASPMLLDGATNANVVADRTRATAARAVAVAAPPSPPPNIPPAAVASAVDELKELQAQLEHAWKLPSSPRSSSDIRETGADALIAAVLMARTKRRSKKRGGAADADGGEQAELGQVQQDARLKETARHAERVDKADVELTVGLGPESDAPTAGRRIATDVGLTGRQKRSPSGGVQVLASAEGQDRHVAGSEPEADVEERAVCLSSSTGVEGQTLWSEDEDLDGVLVQFPRRQEREMTPRRRRASVEVTRRRRTSSSSRSGGGGSGDRVRARRRRLSLDSRMSRRCVRGEARAGRAAALSAADEWREMAEPVLAQNLQGETGGGVRVRPADSTRTYEVTGDSLVRNGRSEEEPVSCGGLVTLENKGEQPGGGIDVPSQGFEQGQWMEEFDGAAADAALNGYGWRGCFNMEWNLDHRLLSLEEERALMPFLVRGQEHMRARATLAKEKGREIQLEELALVLHIPLPDLRRDLQAYQAAVSKLIMHNLRLVVKIVNCYSSLAFDLDLPSLHQRGVKGLQMAAASFYPSRKCRFSTYATVCVRTHVTREIAACMHVRMPTYTSHRYISMKKAHAKLTQELGREPTDAEVAACLGISVKRLQSTWKAYSVPHMYLHQRLTDSGEDMVGILPDLDLRRQGHGDAMTDQGMALAEATPLRFALDDMMESLKPKEALILRQRFGLDGRGGKSLQEIGKNLSISREMVRKYEARALAKLRLPERTETFRSSLVEHHI